MRVSRGLTLLETLAAAVILAAVLATCLPLMLQASSAVREHSSNFTPADLSAFAESVLTDGADKEEQEPTRINALRRGTVDSLELNWPENPNCQRVSVRRIHSEEAADHAWLLFTATDIGGHLWCIAKFIPSLSEEEETK